MRLTLIATQTKPSSTRSSSRRPLLPPLRRPADLEIDSSPHPPKEAFEGEGWGLASPVSAAPTPTTWPSQTIPHVFRQASQFSHPPPLPSLAPAPLPPPPHTRLSSSPLPPFSPRPTSYLDPHPLARPSRLRCLLPLVDPNPNDFNPLLRVISWWSLSHSKRPFQSAVNEALLKHQPIWHKNNGGGR